MDQRIPSCLSLTPDLEYEHGPAVNLEATSLFYLKNFRFVLFSPNKHKSPEISVKRDPSRNNIQQLRKKLKEFAYTVGQIFSVRNICIHLTLFPIFSLPFVTFTHE